MERYRFYDGIGLDERVREAIERRDRELGEREYRRYVRLFHADRLAFFDDVARQADYRLLFLVLYVRMAVDLHEAYRLRDIPDDVYFDTFSDIRIWCRTCERSYGEIGIEEYKWLQEHVGMRLFRLGRLQFQPIAYDREPLPDKRRAERPSVVLNVHIPEGEPLDPIRVQSSFERAEAFFRGIPPVFVCDSWLLYPGLADILPADSNILAFQRLFRIAGTDPDNRQAESRIFGRVLDDPAAYEERTSLQRSAKAYLLSGRKLGNGYGIKDACAERLAADE